MDNISDLDLLKITYEEILLGNKKYFYNKFFNNTTVNNKNKTIVNFIRWVFEHYYGYSLEDIALRVDYKKLKESNLVNLYQLITFPEGYNKKEDVFYIFHLMDPEKYPIKPFEEIERMAIKVRNKERNYPNKYFDEYMGKIRCVYLTRFILSQEVRVSCLEEVYKIFATKNLVKKIYAEYGITNLSLMPFDTPVDMLYYSLEGKQQDKDLYEYYKFYYKFFSNISFPKQTKSQTQKGHK